MQKYSVKEIFYSLQGEGARSGTANVFVRFAGCNLRCKLATHGFDCDTDFYRGEKMSAEEIATCIDALTNRCKNIIFTGGEPALQVNDLLVSFFKKKGYYIAIETNGMFDLPSGIDWVCVSPKIIKNGTWDMSTIKVPRADEVKFVCKEPMSIPFLNGYEATHKWISPSHDGDTPHVGAIDHCINLVKLYPEWRLSVQQHKIWKVR